MNAGLVALGLLFASLSLLAFGGGSAIIPELQHQSVEVYGWLTEQQFVDIYSLTRATPGPGMLLVCLVGYKACGWAGTAVASLGMFGPSSVLMVGARAVWMGAQNSPRRAQLERAMAPLAVGTMMSAATLVARTVDHNAATVITTVAVAALVAYTRVGAGAAMALAALAACLGWLN